MGFVIKKKESFVWPVTIKTPADGGSYEEEVIDFTFKKFGEKEMKKLVEDKSITTKELCKKFVIGWSGVTDESGQEVKFSQKNFDLLIENYGFCNQIAGQYFEAIHKAFVKN